LNRGILARLFDLGSVPTGKLPFLSSREKKKRKGMSKKKALRKKKMSQKWFSWQGKQHAPTSTAEKRTKAWCFGLVEFQLC
jgi:hypothetical protein